MSRLLGMALVAPILLIAGANPVPAADASLVSIRTPRGVTQSFILIKPQRPVASVILLAGGHGALGLRSATSMKWGAGNFLVRSKERFAGHDFAVAVMDAPSDRQQGMNAVFRMGPAHAADLAAVADHLKKLNDAPVWLVGTSMGTFSAAGGAIAARNIDGLVLTSTITRAKPQWDIAKSHRDGIASMALPSITVPALIVSHRNDACDITPATDARKLVSGLSAARKVEVAVLEGGDVPQSEPCEAKSAHGFLGIEAEAVSTIARFIKANGR